MQSAQLVPPLLLLLPDYVLTASLASFVPNLPEAETKTFIESTILPGLAPSVPLDTQRTTVHLVAAVARHLAPSLAEIVPGVLAGIARGDEELREAGLQVRLGSNDSLCGIYEFCRL